MVKIYYLAGLLLFITFSSCRNSPDDLGQASIFLDEYSPENNLQIGDAVNAEVERIYSLLSADAAPEAMEYLEKMLNLVINTPAFSQRLVYDWHISVIRDENVSTAFVLPNGHLYLSIDLLKFLETESQLLSLLAHELSYAESGRASLLLEDEFGKQALGDIILDNGKADVAAMAAAFASLSYDKNAVATADEFSVEVLCPFVYEPRGIVKILEKATENPAAAPAWLTLRPHEDTTERIERMNENAAPCGLDGVKNRAEYTAFLEML